MGWAPSSYSAQYEATAEFKDLKQKGTLVITDADKKLLILLNLKGGKSQRFFYDGKWLLAQSGNSNLSLSPGIDFNQRDFPFRFPFNFRAHKAFCPLVEALKNLSPEKSQPSKISALKNLGIKAKPRNLSKSTAGDNIGLEVTDDWERGSVYSSAFLDPIPKSQNSVQRLVIGPLTAPQMEFTYSDFQPLDGVRLPRKIKMRSYLQALQPNHTIN